MKNPLSHQLCAMAVELTYTIRTGDRNTNVPPGASHGVPRQVHENDNEFVGWNTGTQGTLDHISSCEVTSAGLASVVANDALVEHGVTGVPCVPGQETQSVNNGLATENAADLVAVAGVASVPQNFVSFGPYRSSAKGLFYIAEDDDLPVFLCSPIAIVALTRNDANRAWGRLVEVEDQDGHVHQITISNEMLAKSGGEAVRVLLMSAGATVSTRRASTAHLNEYLATVQIGSRRRIVQTTGWHNNDYVLPDKVYSVEDTSNLVFSNPYSETCSQFKAVYAQAGELETWKNEIGRLAVGNSRLLLVLAIAFAAPMIGRLDVAGGGFHFRGASSIGKTSLIRAASSVFSNERFMQTWRATSAGLEGVAATLNDSLLGLDEISQVAPDAASETAYMLANGLGRTRATKDGQAKEAARFRLLFVSTGEESLADRIRDDRLGRRRAMAGQEIRMLDIPSDVKYGVFESLHGFPSGAALADHIREVSRKQHGTPFDALIKAIMSTPAEGIDDLRARVKSVAGDLSKGLEGGQVLRAAERFAVACVAAQFAAEHDIVSWSSQQIVDAIRTCFTAWLTERGGDGALERTKAILSVQRFIQAHQTSRFEWIGSPNVTEFEPDDTPRINNLAGYYFRGTEGVRYGFTRGGLEEALEGLNLKTAVNNLADAGFLKVDGEGKNSISKRVRTTKIRLYMIDDSILAYE
ncbi:MAG: DUF927 domain-containing protein [Alphaproteobacteria bacterium]|nr:DUF927 domain-containing protein [Alphaproteobacteria bacterium]MBU1561115.1 DUF927 domain-containing protein [Alphaproteobacteria bacterium]MBU2301869.1 DUF927 domain-containing protein [Alphaproteobacteria bacterium]MBU2368729.1 DUF927 domain-containing protein [Alphaproteobacteria bacterium]